MKESEKTWKPPRGCAEDRESAPAGPGRAQNAGKMPAAGRGQDGPHPTALQLFGIFFKISTVTVGGGYAMVPVIEAALEKRGWTTEDEFYSTFAAAQSFPGPLAYTTALMVGKKLSGPLGAAAAGAGVVLPPFITILAVGALIGRFGQLPLVKAFLDGAGATVAGLVAAMIYRMAKRQKWNWRRILGLVLLSAALILAPQATLPVFLAGVVIIYFGESKWDS